MAWTKNGLRRFRAFATGLVLTIVGGAGHLDASVPSASESSEHASARMAEALAETFIEVYNLNDLRTLTDFLEASYAKNLIASDEDLHAWRNRWLRAYSMIGPVEMRYVEAHGVGRIKVWTYGLTTRAWLAFTLETAKDAPTTIVDHSIFSTQRPSALEPGPRMDPSALPGYLQEYLDGLASADAFSGVALLIRKGRIAWSFAAGFSDADDEPIDLETAFDLASVSKMFVAVAALKLREQGRVDFDAPVSKYLESFPAHIGDEITLGLLLSHRSGIRLQENDELYRRLFRAKSFEEQFRLEVEAMEREYPESFEASGKYRYSNEGIDTAARVLEARSGVGYYKLIRETIFQPLEMTSTRRYGSAPERADLVGGRTRWHPPDNEFVPGPRRSNRSFLYDAGRPSGGLVTTGTDLAAFCEALTSGSLLPEKSMADMTSPLALQTETTDYKLFYGLGADVYVYDSGTVYGHGGGRPGTSTRLDIFPDLDMSLVVLSNYDYIAHRIGEHVHEILMVGVY